MSKFVQREDHANKFLSRSFKRRISELSFHLASSLHVLLAILSQIVVGGAINGQAVVWDITKSLSIIDQKKRKQSVRHIGKHGGGSGAGDDDELVASLPPIKPMAISHIDMSHRRLVADLAWLPPTTQVSSLEATPDSPDLPDTPSIGTIGTIDEH